MCNNLTKTISARLKDGVPAAHDDRGPEETERQKQEGLQPGELDVTSVCLSGLRFKKKRHSSALSQTTLPHILYLKPETSKHS